MIAQDSRFPRTSLVFALSVSLLAFLASEARAGEFAVGSGCDHATIGSAIVAALISPEDDLIKITEDLLSQSVVLENFDPDIRGKVTIRGGYTSCGDTTSSGRSIIDGVTSNPVVRVLTSTASDSDAILENLELIGSGVRGIEVLDGGHLTLNNVIVEGNDGGGAFVESGGTMVTRLGTTIQSNGWGASTPASGGGIDCIGGNLDLAGAVHSNRAEIGGGIHGTSGCIAELRSGLDVTNNTATTNGGGVYLTAGSVMIGDGQGSVIAVDANAADQGAGLFVEGATVILADASVSHNYGFEDGAGLYASTNAVVFLVASDGCTTGLPCNLISDNIIDSPSGVGTAVYAVDAEVTLQRQSVVRNQLNHPQPFDEQPRLLYAEGSSAILTLENLEIRNNEATALIEATDGATVVGSYLSTARNTFETGGDTFFSYISVTGTDTTASFYSSIFWDHGGFFQAGPSPFLRLDCLMLNTDFGTEFADVSNFVLVDNPQYYNADSGDLRIPPTSPAVDFCDEAAIPVPGAPDFEDEPRGVDHPLNPNGSPGVPGQLFDIGFDEVQPGDTGEVPIFADGFESGNTSAWTSTTP